MNKIFVGALLVGLPLGAYFMVAKLVKPNQQVKMIQTKNVENDNPVGEPNLSGRLVSILENKIVVAKRLDSQVAQLSNKEREERRAQMANLSEEQREQARQERQQQAQNQESQQLTIDLPQEIKVLKVESGSSQEISINQLEIGRNISIWKNEAGVITHLVQTSFSEGFSRN